MLIVLAALVVATGCGTEPGSGTAPATSLPTTASSPSTTTPAPTTTTTTTTASAPFAAADGTNLQACADGSCEVFVKTGDVLPNASGTGPVRIDVQNGMVAISQVSPSGMSSSLSGYPGMPQQINKQVFLIVAVEGGRGVLRLSTG